jgi:ferredoxin
MKVTIDRMQCVSCGSCWDACPALFVQNADDSFSEIVEEYREKGDRAASIVLPDTVDCARDAADLCPVTIITIVE